MTDSSFVRELCLRAKTAPPHEALAYLEFVIQHFEQDFADLQTQVTSRPDLHGDLKLVESDLAELRGIMLRLSDLITIGGEPVANLQ